MDKRKRDTERHTNNHKVRKGKTEENSEEKTKMEKDKD